MGLISNFSSKESQTLHVSKCKRERERERRGMYGVTGALEGGRERERENKVTFS